MDNPLFIKHVCEIEAMSTLSAKWRENGYSIGFVPTMGALHDGHASLVKKSIAICDKTVVSIFVNPIQFGAGEDFDKYPRDIKKDKALLEAAGAHALFTTTPLEMYPKAFSTTVNPDDGFASKLCGKTRPGHFSGVLTVVAKLFNIVQPHVAFFGQKDLQQAFLIKRMTADLNFPVQIEICPIVRESDGLAMSSRNAYLSKEARSRAPIIHKALVEMKRKIESGNSVTYDELIEEASKTINSASPDKIDYVEILSRETLEKAENLSEPLAACAAVYFGGTRLIDNIFIGPQNNL